MSILAAFLFISLFFVALITVLFGMPYYKSHFSCLFDDKNAGSSGGWRMKVLQESDFVIKDLKEGNENRVSSSSSSSSSLVRSSSSDSSDTLTHSSVSSAIPPIPAILHQTYKDENIPERWKRAHAMCKETLPGYQHIFWTDAKSKAFIQEHYPWFLETFTGYRYPIQRADAIRYFVLLHYGGFYVDLDIGCARNFDLLRNSGASVILAKTEPIGFSNDWMAAAPNHPFIKSLVDHLMEWNVNLLTNYPTVFFSTGPMFLNMLYCMWCKSHSSNSISERSISTLSIQAQGQGRFADGIAILAGKHYGGGAAGISFVAHFHGSSWHSWDAAIIMWIWHHYQSLVLFICIPCIAGYCLYRFYSYKSLSKTRIL
jgi:mannosyltransferase OCH1-like enzyme